MPQARGATGEKGLGAGHPPLFGFSPALVYAAHPDGGGYPIGFLDRAYMTLGVTDPTNVLHLCSGSMRIGVRVDIRPEMQPDIVADCRNVPLPDESFDWIMADPPYSENYAQSLYGTGADYPKPGQIIKEASRLLRPGGRVGILHFQVPMDRVREGPRRARIVTGVATGVRPEDQRNPLVHVSSARVGGPLGASTSADRSIDTDTFREYRSYVVALNDFLDAISKRAFGRTKAEAHENGICIRCGKPVVLGGLSRQDSNEYLISGVCPECFSAVFPDDD